MTNFIRISFVVRTEGTEGRALHEIGFLMTSHSPHCRAVEVDHQPLARVEGDGVRELDSFHPLPELRAHEGRPSVGGVHVEPELFLLADGSQFLQVVKGAGSCGAQSGAQLKVMYFS